MHSMVVDKGGVFGRKLLSGVPSGIRLPSPFAVVGVITKTLKQTITIPV